MTSKPSEDEVSEDEVVAPETDATTSSLVAEVSDVADTVASSDTVGRTIMFSFFFSLSLFFFITSKTIIEVCAPSRAGKGKCARCLYSLTIYSFTRKDLLTVYWEKEKKRHVSVIKIKLSESGASAMQRGRITVSQTAAVNKLVSNVSLVRVKTIIDYPSRERETRGEIKRPEK